MVYCHTCGAANDDSQTYCHHDGTVLHREMNVETSKQSGSFCSSCGSPADAKNNYCNNCGKALFEGKLPYKKKQNMAFSKILPEKMEPSTIKQGVIAAVVAFIVMLGIAFVVFSSNEAFMKELYESVLGDTSNLAFSESYSISDTYKYSSYMMDMNAVHPKLEWNIQDGDENITGNLRLSSGLIINVLLTALIFIITGIILAKRQLTMKVTVVIGGAYAVLMGIASYFSGETLSFVEDSYFIPVYVDLKITYSFFQAFINGFVLSIVFSLIGMAIVYRAKLCTYGKAAYMAVRNWLIFVVLSIVFLIITIKLAIGMDEDFLVSLADMADYPFAFLLSAGTLVGSWFLQFLHFGTWNFFVMLDEGVPVEQTLSLAPFSGYRWSNFYIDDFFSMPLPEVGTGLTIALIIGMLFVAAFTFYSGYKLKMQPKALLIYSGVYALCMMALSYVSNTKVTTTLGEVSTGEEYHFILEIGFDALVIALCSFLFAAAFAFAGAYFRGKRS